jgi:DNA-binding transcriptional LysR family regulator
MASAMDKTVLILTPHGRDAAVAADLLNRHGIPALICEHLNALSSAVEQGAGAALVAEEALASADLDLLAARLEQQPPWSDFPFVVLANGHKGVRSTRPSKPSTACGTWCCWSAPCMPRAWSGRCGPP